MAEEASSPIKAAIVAAMKEAMRAQDKVRLGTIRLILSALKQVEVDERVVLDDPRVLDILNKLLKQRRDSITQFEAAGRDELAQKEKSEMTVIQSFMPQPLAPEDVTVLINQVIDQEKATSIKDMGRVMGLLKGLMEGRADMAQVGAEVKSRLNGGS